VLLLAVKLERGRPEMEEEEEKWDLG